MKLIFVFVCFISVVSTSTVFDRGSPQRMRSLRKSQFSPHLRPRINPHVAKLLLLKNLLEMGCIPDFSNRHLETDQLKSFLKVKFDGTQAAANRASFSSLSNPIGAQTMYFLNPKIIMLPYSKNAAKEIAKEFHKDNAMESESNTKAEDEKGESYQKGNDKQNDFEENRAAGFATTRPFISYDLYTEPMIEDVTMELDKRPGHDSLEKDEQSKLWEKHQQEMDKSLKKYISRIGTPETTTPFYRKKIPFGEGGKSSTFGIPPPTEALPTRYPSRVNSPYRKQDYRKMNIPKGFDSTFSTTTEYSYTAHADWKNEKTGSEKAQTRPNPFFKFFSKISPKNLNIFDNTTNSNSLEKLFDKDAQGLLAENRKVTTENPLKSTSKTPVPETTTVTVKPSKTTLNLFIYPLVTNSNSTIESMNHIKEKGTTLAMPPVRSFTPFTTFRSVKYDADETYATPAFFPTSFKPELLKEQETNAKNSRKMHFNLGVQEEPVTNDIGEFMENKPRRSDILIDESLEDYVNDENQVSTLSYLDKLHQNDTMQSRDFLDDAKLDSYIPLIPDILSDIRDKKISQEDLSRLSGVFGKHWPKILALSNTTELDVLPLLKIKNEDDLAKFLDGYFTKDMKTHTTEKSTMKELYDYLEEYKDFYEDFLAEGVDGKRKRYRRKRDAKPDSRKTRARREFFKSLLKEKKLEGMSYMGDFIPYENLENETPPVKQPEISE